jgi:amino acid permease
MLPQVITGAGMMAIPRAFMQVGWLPGSTMLIGVAVLTFFSLAVLVQGSAAAQASTYGELVCRTCGRGLMRLLQLAVLLFCFGFSVVYLVSSETYQQVNLCYSSQCC